MARRFLISAWDRLQDIVLASPAHRRPVSYVLLFRLENTELFKRRLKSGGYARLLALLSARIGTGSRKGCRLRNAPPGTFAFAIKAMPMAKAMSIAKLMQKHAEQTLTISDQTCTPVLSGLILPNTRTSPFCDADVIFHGAKLFDELDQDCVGCINWHTIGEGDTKHSANRSSTGPAMSQASFTSVLQPLICCRTGRVTGFELRTLNDADSNKKGDSFISELQSGIKADSKVPFQTELRNALNALRYWDKFDADIPRASIILPANELQKPEFSDWMQAELASMKMPPSRLVLRIGTEKDAPTPTQSVRMNIQKLRGIGCRFELCGFGVGFAGFEMLRNLAVDSIRIDKSYVFCCDIDPKQRRTIRAIMAMAEQMEVGTVAEGIESPEEQAYLAQLGCQEVQGCAISPPMSLEETLGFVAGRRASAVPLPDFTSKQIE